MPFENASVLITGGTGSFGHAFAAELLRSHSPRRIIIFSRDELKQSEMREAFPDERMRFFLGDVRDGERLRRAFEDVDIVVHAAALKQVPAAEYNPFECIKTNVLGAQNVIEASLATAVTKVIALSTDKAANPINLYGATKLCSDKLFIAGNSYIGQRPLRMAVVRYGNVVGSRGSVVPFFRRMRETGCVPITDAGMTRFWITLEEGVRFVIESLKRMRGGELFVPKIPSADIMTIADALAPDCRKEIVGVRPGEKLHELMITTDDARRTRDVGDHYVIEPDFPWWDGSHLVEGKAVADGFSYRSDNNPHRLSVEEVRQLLRSLNLA